MNKNRLDSISLHRCGFLNGGLSRFGERGLAVARDPGKVSGHSLYPSLVPSLLLVA